MTAVVPLTAVQVVAQMREHLTACTPLFNTLDHLSAQPGAFDDGTLAREVEDLLGNLGALTAMVLMVRHLGRMASGKPNDRETIGPFVTKITQRATEHLAVARARLDALLLESDNLAGLGTEVVKTKRGRRIGGRYIAVQAVKLLRELRFAENDLEELRVGLEGSNGRVVRGFRARMAEVTSWAS